MKWIIREQQKAESQYNAGSKARNDIDKILLSMEFSPLVVEASPKNNYKLFSAFNHYRSYKEWIQASNGLKSGDVIIIQYPVRNHTLLIGRVLKKLQSKGVFTIAVIHDLESLRMAISDEHSSLRKFRYRLEELAALKFSSKIIVHNKSMKSKMSELFNIPEDKMIELGVFDYLSSDLAVEKEINNQMPVIIAGNLDKKKSGYIYNLPSDVNFILYGANYTGSSAPNIDYRGKVAPDDLPTLLLGSFGLVWDGEKTDTCAGVYGEYLKYNNPHKVSLYLAAGIPVIVWSKSALAQFVHDNNCGISIDSLSDIKKSIEHLSETDYSSLLTSVSNIKKKLNDGYFIKEALKKL